MNTMIEKTPGPTKSLPTVFALCGLVAFGVWGYQTKARVIPFQSLSEEHHIGEETPKRKRVVMRPVQEARPQTAAAETANADDDKPSVDELLDEQPKVQTDNSEIGQP